MELVNSYNVESLLAKEFTVRTCTGIFKEIQYLYISIVWKILLEIENFLYPVILLKTQVTMNKNRVPMIGNRFTENEQSLILSPCRC